MKMVVAALIAGVVLGFVDAKFIAVQIQKVFVEPGVQDAVSAGLVAFLGSLWGWVVRGTMGAKSKP